jgi:hypothetical protein
MLMEKLSIGVLRVMTPAGPRYIKPTLSRRVYLLWMFRHFDALPLKVLSRRQQRLVDDLCSQRRFVPAPNPHGDDTPILGTVDWQPQMEEQEATSRRPNTAVRAAVTRLASVTQNRS